MLGRAALILITAAVVAACGGGDETPTAGPDPSGGEIEIDSDGSLQNACFSPDGTQIAFTRFADGYNRGLSVVAVVAVDGGTPTDVSTADAQNVNLPGSCWNEATDEITFTSDDDARGDKGDEIYSVAPGGGPPRLVTDLPDAVAFEPSYSPDGEWIVFESHAVGDDDPGTIWKVRADGSDLTQLTDGFDDRQPNWSPAGDVILFQSDRSGNLDIWTMDADGDGLLDVTDDPAEDTDASWSPDGGRIVFSSDRGDLDFAGLFVVGANGGDVERVELPDDIYAGAPSWSPDGAWIAYETAAGEPDGSAGTRLALVAAPQEP